MPHRNRGLIAVNAEGNWDDYVTDVVLDKYKPYGTVTKAREIGALLQEKKTGVFVMITKDGKTKTLSQKKVIAALKLPLK